MHFSCNPDLRFLYDFVSPNINLFSTTIALAHTFLQVTYPNRIFSATIISSVVHNADIKKTAEWQLLLGAMALPGVFIGAVLCNPLGRRNTVSKKITLPVI